MLKFIKQDMLRNMGPCVACQVYMMAIDTVMLSFCEDCEAHGGEPRKAPPILLHALNTAAAAEEERAASG